MENKCYEKDEEAPSVGCGCSNCYHARRESLDPNLIKLGTWSTRGSLNGISWDVVNRRIQMYLKGRIEYAALHVGIIKVLMELTDKQFDQGLEIASRQSAVSLTLGGEK